MNCAEREAQVKDYLAGIEQERGRSMVYYVTSLQNQRCDVRIQVHPRRRNLEARIFDLSSGCTPGIQDAIREWFVPLLDSNYPAVSSAAIL